MQRSEQHLDDLGVWGELSKREAEFDIILDVYKTNRKKWESTARDRNGHRAYILHEAAVFDHYKAFQRCIS